MRYLVLSDIHANLPALEAVLAHAKGGYDAILNCGDLVGYGEYPNEVVDWVRATPQTVIRGNHDRAACGLLGLDWFNERAQRSTIWTQGQLHGGNLDFLRGLRRGPVAQSETWLVHGAPSDEDKYVFEAPEAAEEEPFLPGRMVFFGHTHCQGGFRFERLQCREIEKRNFATSGPAAWLINPGSVGFPRDGDARPAYAIYDDEARFLELLRAPNASA